MPRLMLGGLGVAFALCMTAAAQAGSVGFTQDFNDGNGGFGGGSQSYTLQTSGGVGGAADGYLEVGNLIFANRLGTRTLASEFTGSLVADGVTGFSFWLNDVGGDDDLEIHVGVGQAFGNFWLSVDGFAPPENEWAQFSVDFTNPSEWVQIIGGGLFEDALESSNRLLFRHDVDPLALSPAVIQGDVGIDRITVVPEPTSLCLLAGCAVAAASRRRRGDRRRMSV